MVDDVGQLVLTTLRILDPQGAKSPDRVLSIVAEGLEGSRPFEEGLDADDNRLQTVAPSFSDWIAQRVIGSLGINERGKGELAVALDAAFNAAHPDDPSPLTPDDLCLLRARHAFLEHAMRQVIAVLMKIPIPVKRPEQRMGPVDAKGNPDD